jgi:hypothetical protein
MCGISGIVRLDPSVSPVGPDCIRHVRIVVLAGWGIDVS